MPPASGDCNVRDLYGNYWLLDLDSNQEPAD
jgi:hypothetical protein